MVIANGSPNTPKLSSATANRVYVPGARAAGCRLAPEGEGTDVRVTMTLAAALDRPLPDRVHQVRRAVVHSAGQDLGLAVSAVDITVVDVLEPWPLLGPGLATGGGT